MDTFENFQYDSASSYGGIGVVDDTSSVYTANTASQSSVPVDLEGLSIQTIAPSPPLPKYIRTHLMDTDKHPVAEARWTRISTRSWTT